MMKAILWTKYGSPDVLKFKEVEKPTPKDNEVLIKIHATTVSQGDCEMRNLKLPMFLWVPMRMFMGIIRPRKQIMGQELAGEIEAVGKDVTQFKTGDQVFAFTGLEFGSYAEYICLPETPETGAIAIKPTNMTYEEAAPVPLGGITALHFMRKANIQTGQKVLINGAGGTIGTFAVQLAKFFGAEVTAVDSTAKLSMLRAIGADHVIDYTQEDFTQNGQTYDVIFDVPGKSVLSRSIKSLKQNGRFLLGSFGFSEFMYGLWVSRFSDKQFIFGMDTEKLEDLLFLKELIEAGILTSVIDRRYPLEKTAEAHRYVETRQKLGHVIITVAT